MYIHAGALVEDHDSIPSNTTYCTGMLTVHVTNEKLDTINDSKPSEHAAIIHRVQVGENTTYIIDRDYRV